MKKHKLCAHCQYFRPANMIPTMPDGDWCSNSQSKFTLEYVTGFDTCRKFSKKGKKAPLWMRVLNKVMK